MIKCMHIIKSFSSSFYIQLIKDANGLDSS